MAIDTQHVEDMVTAGRITRVEGDAAILMVHELVIFVDTPADTKYHTHISIELARRSELLRAAMPEAGSTSISIAVMDTIFEEIGLSNFSVSLAREYFIMSMPTDNLARDLFFSFIGKLLLDKHSTSEVH